MQERMSSNKQHLFLISINVYLIRCQLKSNFHNFGECLENMTVKQEQEHSMTRRQNFVVIVRRHLFDPFSSFHGTFKYHKIETKQAYYIRIADFY